MSLEENISPRIVSELTTHLALGNVILLVKSGHQTPSRQQQPWTTLLNISMPVYVGQAYTPWLICYSPHYTPCNRAVQRQNKSTLPTWKIISVWLRKDMGMSAQSAYIFLYFAYQKGNSLRARTKVLKVMCRVKCNVAQRVFNIIFIKKLSDMPF